MAIDFGAEPNFAREFRTAEVPDFSRLACPCETYEFRTPRNCVTNIPPWFSKSKTPTFDRPKPLALIR